jgi:hypothetical protein
MARLRIRTIKPELWNSDDFNALSAHGRLVFLWLIGQADDEGRLKASADLIAARNAIPVEDVVEGLRVMVERGMLASYSHESSPAHALVNWRAHQKVDHPTTSTIPPPPNTKPGRFGETSRKFAKARDDSRDLANFRASRGSGLVRSGLVRSGPSSNGAAADHAPAHEAPDDFAAFVAELNTATGRRFVGDAKARKLYRQRVNEGRTADELLAAARGVACSPHHMGQNDGGIPYNAPANVLRSRVLDQLIALGTGEIGVTKRDTPGERREDDIDRWAAGGEA